MILRRGAVNSQVGMISRSRLIFIVFYVTVILIATVSLRSSATRTFNRYRVAHVAAKDLKQQLFGRQLQLERLMNPGTIPRRRLDEDGAK